ncbi:hypothetical protein K488DRAFT_40846 [Vararia minispora EC-137]|uniref:Uncharacterized protein n=1 Tax=Vararia minispora EC-137 TaxID=1314806 RepID=A0ACB8QYV0_9AGAM|nr:hypothetical protein K488DRAFT_40846 [Vararia minispora EC-137]
MDSLDTSWCPVCGRHILPKRYLVPVCATNPEPQPAPAPPPSSPSSSSPDKVTRNPSKPRPRAPTVRPRGGLVRGTGRVRPNGSIKRADSKKDAAPTVPAQPEQPTPIRHRTVIDQNPTPLYCSDECRLADLDAKHYVPIDYNPHRDIHRDQCPSPTLPPVPHNSLCNSFDETESSISASSSPDSHDGLDASDYLSVPWESMSPSIARLARFYDFPPLPARPKVIEDEATQERSPKPEPHPSLEDTYTSGVMMAGERIKEALCTPRPKQGRGFAQAPTERKSVVGWTDGSDAWRASVYSFSSPKDTTIRDLKKPDERPRAYNSFAASTHRSTGVYSTVSDVATPTASVPTRASTVDDVAQYPLTFARRSDSRPSLGFAHSLPTTTRSLVMKGAEGKLLVPDVQLKVRSPSSYASSDIGSLSTKSWRSCSHRSFVRSPLSRYGSDLSVSVDDDERSSEPKTASKRPAVETRSWSYDNVRTYDIMPMPTSSRKEKRLEQRVVDGKPVLVEVEVEVELPLKRLFLFPAKATVRA